MSKFKISLNWFDLPRISSDADQVAKDSGMRGKDDIDSFRHGYATAKSGEKYGNAAARIGGIAVELFNPNNNSDDAYVDLRNNEIGLQILNEVEQEVQRQKAAKGLSNEEAEALQDEMLRTKVADAVRAGQMGQHPFRNMDENSATDEFMTHPYGRKRQ